MTDTEKRVANFAYLLGFGFFFMIYVYTSFKTKVIKRRSRSRENFRNADRSLFVVKTRCCPALKYYSGWMSLFSMVMILLFFIFQAAAEIDLCWDDSKDIYRGTEKRQISQRAYLDFLRKSAYGFVVLLAAQLCVWDTTPEKKDQDGDGVEEKTLELENIHGSRRRQARRARRRKRRLKRQKDRFKSMRNLPHELVQHVRSMRFIREFKGRRYYRQNCSTFAKGFALQHEQQSWSQFRQHGLLLGFLLPDDIHAVYRKDEEFQW